MSRAVDPLPSLGLLGALPWRTKVGDRRAVRKLLIVAGIDPRGALARDLLPVLSQRVSDCRDLFVLRGVRTRRRSVLQMAGRALASDAEQIAKLDALTNGMAGALLRALSDLIEVRAGHPARARVAPTVPAPESAGLRDCASVRTPPRVDPRPAPMAPREAQGERSCRMPRAASAPDTVAWNGASDEGQRLAA
ncbi:hypothetical protein [Phenylobacterium sp.]|uniref:hypothetical protein n=1 Tax=Phenylobacterium sp. TaxID=1871053 RepID=UPI00286BD8CD|nr:hypothetical protein [Phenylobacterium sp.]